MRAQDEGEREKGGGKKRQQQESLQTHKDRVSRSLTCMNMYTHSITNRAVWL